MGAGVIGAAGRADGIRGATGRADGIKGATGMDTGIDSSFLTGAVGGVVGRFVGIETG